MIRMSSNLIPAKKGEVRNPNGKKKGTKHIKTILKKYLSQKLDIENPTTGEMQELTLLEAGILKMIQQYIDGDDKARKEVFDRVFGKVPDMGKVEHSGNIEIQIIRKPNDDD